MVDSSIRGGLEENILTMLLWVDRHCSTIAMMVDPELYNTTAYQQIAKAAIPYIQQYGRPPKGHIFNLLENDLRTRDTGRFMREALEASQRWASEINAEYVMAELEKWVRVRSRMVALDKAQAALADGDEEQAELLLYEGKASAQYHIGTWLHDDNLDFMTTRETDIFSSGVTELDKRNIRPERETLTVFIAPRKAGKSWWCVNLGKANMTGARKSVLHVTLENSEKLTKRRYMQAIFGMTKRELTHGERFHVPALQNDDKKFQYSSIEIAPKALTMENRADIRRKLRGLATRPKLLIKGFPSGQLTLAQLNLFLDMLKRDHGFTPDLLIVDYPALMALNTNNYRLDLGRLFIGLRGIGVARNMAVCAPTQGSRPSADANLVTSSKHLAEDWSIAGTADTLLTYSRTAKEKERGLARILVDAARDESDSFVVLIAQSYATGQFCLDSVYLNKAVEQDLGQITNEIDHDADEADTADERYVENG